MIGKVIATGARLLCGCRARWLEAPVTSEPHVFYANHSSHLDALIVWSALPETLQKKSRIVAAADYWNATRMRRWLAHKAFPTLLIDREQVTRENNPLRSMLSVWDAGQSLIIFPEGSRGTGEQINPFRAGLWHMARKRPEMSFIPVWLENLSRVLPKGDFLPVPIMTAVTFGASIKLQTDQSKPAFLELLRRHLLKISTGNE